MDPLTAIERHNNFRHIFQSLLVLFRQVSPRELSNFLNETSGDLRRSVKVKCLGVIITITIIILMIMMIIVTMVRCATGEAWPDIMLAGIGGRPCDPKSYNRFVLFELKMLKEVKIYFFNILRQGIWSKYCRVVLTLVPTLLIPVLQEFNHG